MRLVSLVAATVISATTASASAAQIREFDLKTLERLGNDLLRR
jgi:hypothetical protein